MRIIRGLACLLLLTSCAMAAGAREVAITIDDLPRGGDGGPYDAASTQAMTATLLRPFREQQVPVIGFVNAGRNAPDPQGLRRTLEMWLDAGAELGNHSWSHPDINSVPLAQYTADIEKGEPLLRELLQARGRKLEFYRHPFLHTGATAEARNGLQAWLDSRGYRVAPVTFDNADYMFAALYQRSTERRRVRAEYLAYMESVIGFFEQRTMQVVGRDIPQILLIHANQLNADAMPELLDMFRRRGYTFITLARALQDPAYRLPETYVGRGGFSWIHRWSKTRGMPDLGEPEPAAWVVKGFQDARAPVPGL